MNGDCGFHQWQVCEGFGAGFGAGFDLWQKGSPPPLHSASPSLSDGNYNQTMTIIVILAKILLR